MPAGRIDADRFRRVACASPDIGSGCADLGARHPAFATLASAAATIDGDPASFSVLERCLLAGDVRNAAGMPLCVRDEKTLSDDRGYEARVLDAGTLAVRPGSWHDLFNVLVWRTFPRAKAVLNERHCAALDRRPGAPRGALRDALTLLDESGVIVAASDTSLLDAVRGFRWKELFWHRRAELARCLRVRIFGHAVYEKLLCPYVGLTGHAALFCVPQAVIDAPIAEQTAVLDHYLSELLRDSEALQSPGNLHPIPLLGVPGWHPDTMSERFYDDRDYFRPGRRSRRVAAVG